MKNIKEVRYLDTKGYNIPKEKPLKDTETIRVYHGFYSYDTALEVLKKGLSGKERARRIYSFESGNNPYGLFVTVDFEAAAKFASSGIIIEFTTKISDLEAPVWVGGRSYFVQGEYSQSFKDLDEREQQRLLNRQRAGESPYDAISKSDRPELAETLFDNPERQALYIGDLNPNMIKRVWYNETRHIKRLINGPWEKYSVKEFLNYKEENKTKKRKRIDFYPNDDFTIEKFKSFIGNDEENLKNYLDQILNYDLHNDYTLKQYGFWPKQIKQIRDLHSKGYFDKYLNESKLIKEFIDLSNHYEYKTLQENNKIGFYQFTTDKGIIYNVNLGIYINNIKGYRFNSLNIDFTANGSWELKPNNKDTYKTLNTIAKIIGVFYNKNKHNIDYISYVIQDSDKNKKHKLYQYILNKLNIKIINIFKQGSDIYSEINKNNLTESKIVNIIKEELSKVNPLNLPEDTIIQNIIDYLYKKFDNSFNIIDYSLNEDSLKEKLIELTRINNLFNNKYNITLELTFNIISNQNGYNIDNIIINHSKEPGLYKDDSEGRGYKMKKIKSFDSSFYRKLSNEIIQQFRFDRGDKAFKKSDINLEKYPIEYDLIDNRYRIPKSFINYTKNILNKEDQRKPYISKLKAIVDNIIKNNYYSSKKIHDILKRYIKGNL